MDRILPLSGHNLRSLSQTFARFDHYYQARFRNRFGRLVDQLARFIPRGGVVLDIGANHGKFTRNFARIHNGSCRVLAFEPLEYNYSLLRSIVGSMKNVATFNIALSDRAGTTDLYVPIRPSGRISPGCAHLGDESHAVSFGTSTAKEVRKTTVVTQTLDSLLAQQGIPSVDFIKLDVQGAESLVIQGGVNSLRLHKPAIWCELSRGCPEYLGLTVNNSVDLLTSLGYRLHALDERTGELRATPFTDSVRDYLLLHPDRQQPARERGA